MKIVFHSTGGQHGFKNRQEIRARSFDLGEWAWLQGGRPPAAW